VNFDNNQVVGDMNISWKDTTLQSVDISLYDPENKMVNNMDFNYQPNKSVSFSMNAENEVAMTLEMLLGATGNISQIDMMMEVEEYMDMTMMYER